MHQQQWLAVIEELGGHEGTSADAELASRRLKRTRTYAYNFFSSSHDGTPPAKGRWTEGPSLDGKSTFSVFQNKPLGEEPKLGPAPKNSMAETQQIG